MSYHSAAGIKYALGRKETPAGRGGEGGLESIKEMRFYKAKLFGLDK
jgi:hypothetical protein